MSEPIERVIWSPDAGDRGDVTASVKAIPDLDLESGIFVNVDPIFTIGRNKLVELAARHAVPSMYYDRQFAEVGGLMSYGETESSRVGHAAYGSSQFRPRSDVRYRRLSARRT